jgi:Fe-S oxidoreductase
MALERCRADMEMCCRCSICKFIPLEKVTNFQHASVCPSIARYNFHAYSGGGRLSMGVALLEKRFDYSDTFLNIIYNCQMCGACDVSCKYAMDMEVLDPINEMRIGCVESGHTLASLDNVVKLLREKGTLVPSGLGRGEWARGLAVKDISREKAEVIYHVGCRTSLNRSLWKVASATTAMLQKAGVDAGVHLEDELCCGGRAYQMGYREDFLRQAKHNAERFDKSGAKILVTGCAECYHAYKVLYEKFKISHGLEVLHTSQYFSRLIGEGRLKPSKEVRMKVAYHDPCYLGRLGEPYEPWSGTKVPGHMFRFNPPKPYRRGTYGVYQPPRDVLASIPGLTLVEMDRTKEYAWCCGAGGGVKESNPTFSRWTALQRIEEARSMGAEGVVTGCPGCERNLSEAAQDHGTLAVYDIAELLDKAI